MQNSVQQKLKKTMSTETYRHVMLDKLTVFVSIKVLDGRMLIPFIHLSTSKVLARRSVLILSRACP